MESQYHTRNDLFHAAWLHIHYRWLAQLCQWYTYVYSCQNAPRGATENPKKTAIHLSWMDPEDFVVTLSFEHINNTYRNKCAQVHRNKSKAAPEYHAAC